MPVVKHLNANVKSETAANYFWHAMRSFTFGSMSTTTLLHCQRVLFSFRPYGLYFSNYGPTVDIAVQTKAKVTAQ